MTTHVFHNFGDHWGHEEQATGPYSAYAEEADYVFYDKHWLKWEKKPSCSILVPVDPEEIPKELLLLALLLNIT